METEDVVYCNDSVKHEQKNEYCLLYVPRREYREGLLICKIISKHLQYCIIHYFVPLNFLS